MADRTNREYSVSVALTGCAFMEDEWCFLGTKLSSSLVLGSTNVTRSLVPSTVRLSEVPYCTQLSGQEKLSKLSNIFDCFRNSTSVKSM